MNHLRKCLLRAVSMAASMTIVIAWLTVSLTACGDDSEKQIKKVNLRIMSWNGDFRELMETYYIPRHQKLMQNVEIEWVTDEINSYRDSVARRLSDGEHIDIFLGNNEMAPFFAANEKVAPLSQLGITEADLSDQYRFTRTLGSDSSGVQKGSAMDCEPGVLLYRSDYAERYLGITHQDEMQEKLSSWDSFIAMARTLNEQSEGKVRMLPNSAELWKSVNCAMSGLWLTDGQLSVSDDTVAHWLDIVKELYEVNAFADVKSLEDDWYSAVDSGVFCFYAAPWLCRSGSPANADITTVFSSARRSGVSFGKFKTSLAPDGFVYGGTWLYCPQNSENKGIVAEIIRSFTCDEAFMKLLALAEVRYVNNSKVCNELAAIQIPNPLFDGLDAFSVYNSAARSLEFAPPTIYDNSVSSLLYNQTKAYAKGETTVSEAAYNFRLNVWKKYEEITSEPLKPAY